MDSFKQYFYLLQNLDDLPVALDWVEDNERLLDYSNLTNFLSLVYSLLKKTTGLNFPFNPPTVVSKFGHILFSDHFGSVKNTFLDLVNNLHQLIETFTDYEKTKRFDPTTTLNLLSKVDDWCKKNSAIESKEELENLKTFVRKAKHTLDVMIENHPRILNLVRNM